VHFSSLFRSARGATHDLAALLSVTRRGATHDLADIPVSLVRMTEAGDVFVGADDLEGLPAINRLNYEFELDHLVTALPEGASVLQVGSMDGLRAARLLQRRPDLHFTGLDIDASLVDLAKRTVQEVGVSARFVLGDIVDPPELPRFDWVICLNHTLGYIPALNEALASMRRMGSHVVVSVYGEAFDDAAAAAYFDVLGLHIERFTIGGLVFGNGWVVHRFLRSDVEAWGGKLSDTPLGYLVEFSGSGSRSSF
jgi:SAM-dependent methyltransferase